MHIFSNCKAALLQGRYSWRHDSVLKALEPTLLKHIKTHNDNKTLPSSKHFIKFVKKGGRVSACPAPTSLPHLLSPAHDWRCLIDYRDHNFVFPVEICITELRPDIVIWSSSAKTVILMELTCPSEENILQAKARKTARYLPLIQLIQSSGWSVSLQLLEAGVRGMLSLSFSHNLRSIGLSNTLTRQMCKIVETVSRCSYIISQAHRQNSGTSNSSLCGSKLLYPWSKRKNKNKNNNNKKIKKF